MIVDESRHHAPVGQGIEHIDGGDAAFLNHLAHDLSAPMTYLVGYSEMLVRGQLDPASAAEASLEIFREACRMADLVAVMLEAARARQGRLNLRVTTVDLTAVLDQAVERWRLARPDVSIAMTGPARCSLPADRERLVLAVHAMLGLLVGAATNASERVVRIDLSVTRIGESWEIAARGGARAPRAPGVAVELAREALDAIAAAHGGAFVDDGQPRLVLPAAPARTLLAGGAVDDGVGA